MGTLEKVFISLLGTAFFGLLFALLAWINVFSNIESQWKLTLNIVIIGVMLVSAIGSVLVAKVTLNQKSKDNP